MTTRANERVLLKEQDAAGKTYYRMTRVDAYKRYVLTIKPLDDLLKSLGVIK